MNDRAVVLMVVAYLGAIVLAIIGAGFALRLKGVDVPDQMWTIGSVALGAMGALLANTHSSPPNPPPPPGQPEA